MLVQKVQQVIKEWFQLVPELAWVIENPVGSLQKQEYMGADWHQHRKLAVVHYCGYQHVYHKPTHIWTNIFKWKPRGETGTGKGNKWKGRLAVVAVPRRQTSFCWAWLSGANVMAFRAAAAIVALPALLTRSFVSFTAAAAAPQETAPPLRCGYWIRAPVPTSR